MTACLFCKIIEKELPTTLVYEDEHVIAFEDIAPQAPHHILFVPKLHIATLNDVTPKQSQVLGYLPQAAIHLAKERGIAESGYRLVMNCNAEGGQTVFHIHLHLLGGRSLTWPPG